MSESLIKYNDLPCCPEFTDEPCCDVLDLRRRLVFPTNVRDRREQAVAVEVVIHTRFTRCPGPLSLGDPVYTTTLLPGEKVRLATTDRRSRFSFDTQTNLSYRSEQLSEEQYRMSSLRAFMADQNSTDNGSSRNADSGSWDFHGDASGSIGFLSASADANAHGSHNAQSTSEYLRQHSAHASMAESMSVQATRMAHSLSVGEVSTRSHQEGQSEDHFESSSRTFENKNQCHALTFLFYRINKTETLMFEIVAIERRVLDPAAPVPVLANPIRTTGSVAVMPQEVPATAADRVATHVRAFESEAVVARGVAGAGAVGVVALAVNPNAVALAPLPAAVRAAALAEVDKALIEQGLLGENGELSPGTKEAFGFSRTSCIPTAGVIVKGCLDECNVCEPELKQEMKLRLERMKLENDLLKRQVDLLDKAQEYRCCPVAEEDGSDDE